MISPECFKKLMASLLAPATISGATSSKIAIAVSGGADSLALVLLMDEWAKSCEESIVGLTVDHGLRPESAKEANQVAEWLKQRGISHHILTYEGPPILSRLQEKARKARYDLLLSWCLENEASALLTAHHAQDQLETFLLRLSKGSGLRGLCGILPHRQRQGVHILRPLLNQDPQSLKETLIRFGQDFIQDPSNTNLKFARVRLRQNLTPPSSSPPPSARSPLEQLGLSSATILKTMGHLQQVQLYLETEVQQLLKKVVSFDRVGHAELDLVAFLRVPHELRRQLLESCLLRVGGKVYPPPRFSVERMLERLEQEKTVIATLAGCLVQKRQLKSNEGQIIIKRESRKRKQECEHVE